MAKRLQFFIVDDDQISIKLLSNLLKKESHIVSSNTSSTIALTEIIEQVPDCVILDMMMPEMDALELIKRLRAEPDQLVDFVAGTAILITDCTYTDKEYEAKVGWGHSSVRQVVDLAARARVKTLYLFHHDPGQKDVDIDAKLKSARAMLKKKKSSTQCEAPRERQVVQL